MNLIGSVRELFDPQADGAAEAEDEKGRFVLTGSQTVGGMLICTLTDRETGVSYITKPGNDCPLTPLIGADGLPYMGKR